MGQVRWTEPALDDVYDIVGFVAKDSPAYAERLAARLMAAPRRLEIEPRTGWQVPEFDQDHIRELLVRPYRIIYVIRQDICSIVAVVHASRDLTKLFRPEDLEEMA